MGLTAKKGPHSVEVLDAIEKQESSSLDSDSLKNFNLKSEFLERNIVIPEPSEEDLKKPVITNVRVITEQGEEDILPSELRSIIDSNEDIQQVVIEKISVNEATRVSLLFEPGQELSSDLLDDQTKGLLGESELPKEESVSKPSYSLSDIENIINENFIKKVNEEPVKIDDFLSKFSVKESPEVEIEPEETSESEARIEVSRSHSQTEIETQSDEDSNSGFQLKLKQEGSENLVEKKLNYSKHTLNRKTSNRHNGHYYRAKDHMELFKVGSSYMKDFKSGLKSFSFLSHGINEVREQSVFGICSYFNYHSDLNMLIVTTSLEGSFYKKFVGDFKRRKKPVFDEGFEYEFFQTKGFDVLEFLDLRRVEKKMRSYNFEDFLEELMDSYDLILWDLPDIEILDANKEVYFPVVRCLDNVSIVVSMNDTGFSQVEDMMSYFRRYQVDVKGVLVGPDKKGKDVA